MPLLFLQFNWHSMGPRVLLPFIPCHAYCVEKCQCDGAFMTFFLCSRMECTTVLSCAHFVPIILHLLAFSCHISCLKLCQHHVTFMDFSLSKLKNGVHYSLKLCQLGSLHLALLLDKISGHIGPLSQCMLLYFFLHICIDYVHSLFFLSLDASLTHFHSFCDQLM